MNDDAGIDTFTFVANTNNATTNATRTIEMLDTPLSLTLLEPSTTDYATATIPLSLTTNIPADLCYIIGPDGTNTLTELNTTTYNGTITLADGIYTLIFKCTRNGEISQQNITLRIDTTPPTITLTPSGNVVAPLTLTATTNEIADCRYDTQPQPYDQMAFQFPQSSSLTHAANLTLVEGSLHLLHHLQRRPREHCPASQHYLHAPTTSDRRPSP